MNMTTMYSHSWPNKILQNQNLVNIVNLVILVHLMMLVNLVILMNLVILANLMILVTIVNPVLASTCTAASTYLNDCKYLSSHNYILAVLQVLARLHDGWILHSISYNFLGWSLEDATFRSACSFYTRVAGLRVGVGWGGGIEPPRPLLNNNS